MSTVEKYCIPNSPARVGVAVGMYEGKRGKSFAFVMRGKKGKEGVKLPPTDPYPYWVDMHGDESLIAGDAEKTPIQIWCEYLARSTGETPPPRRVNGRGDGADISGKRPDVSERKIAPSV